MVKVLVVGSISTDFVVTTKQRPNVGETLYGEDFKTSFGGKGANQAVVASRLGAETSIIGAVGDDEFGKTLIRNLMDNKIDVEEIKVEKNTPSGAAHITVSDGDNSIIYVPGANNKVYPSDIDKTKELIGNMDVVLVQNETPADTVEKLIEVCAELNVSIIYDPAPARELSQNTIDQCTYLTPNESEFQVLFPDKNLEKTLEEYPNKLIVTLGSEGVIFHDGEKIVKLDPIKVENVIDTTGAGDTFNGALGFAIGSGMDLNQSIQFANLTASEAIKVAGAQDGAPYLAALKELENYSKGWNIF